jgi:uncharacterized low-complexity protein
MNILKKSISALMFTVLSFAFLLSLPAKAEVNPFADQSVMHFASDSDSKAKCGEGKCGESKAKAKCGEGKCGEGKAKAKCGEGKCGEGKK